MTADVHLEDGEGPHEHAARRRDTGRTRKRRELPVREIARRLLLFAAVDTFVSLLLPWIVTDRGSINAFALGSGAMSIPGARWIGVAIWLSVAAAVVCAAIAAIDRRRPLGLLPSVAAILVGALQVGVCAYLFETVVVLRQIGALAFGLGGVAYFGSGALLTRARWRHTSSGWASIFAELSKLPWTAIALTAANVIVYLALGFRSDYQTVILREFGIIGGSVRWYAPVTCMFLHADWIHLLANVAVLMAVGSAIEVKGGRVTFGLVYFAGGIAGALLSVAIDPRIHAPLVGSSGAVAGVLGLCLATAPRQRVTIWIHAVVAVARLEMQAAWLFSAWIALQAVGSFYLAMGQPDGIAYWGHLGGVGVGLAVGVALRFTGRSPSLAEREQESSDAPERQKRPHGTAGRLRRAGARPFDSVPLALTIVALLLSVSSVVVTFTSDSLIAELASFATDWNTGELNAVAAHFESDVRQEHLSRLHAIMREMDPASPAGRTRVRIALTESYELDGECRASFRSVIEEDPYRATTGGRMFVILEKSGGRWWVRALGLSEIMRSGSASP